VIAAVKSLYVDKVQPMGRVLLKRVGERAAFAVAKAAGCGQAGTINHNFVPCIDPKHLRKVCEKCEQLIVENIENGEYYALLQGRPPVFIDACSDQDPYPPRLWQDLSLFFSKLEGDEIFLPSGRFACAQALAMRGLSCLAGRSLGELCHIVQLAITHKKILGYRDGDMVPYWHSELMEKEHCAYSQQPIAAMKGNVASAPIATWEQVRTCLRTILAGQSCGSVPLPNVKRLFRSKFGLELSETSLGHSRLFELLRDPRLLDVCSCHLQDNKWTVAGPQAAHALHLSLLTPPPPNYLPLTPPPNYAPTYNFPYDAANEIVSHESPLVTYPPMGTPTLKKDTCASRQSPSCWAEAATAGEWQRPPNWMSSSSTDDWDSRSESDVSTTSGVCSRRGRRSSHSDDTGTEAEADDAHSSRCIAAGRAFSCSDGGYGDYFSAGDHLGGPEFVARSLTLASEATSLRSAPRKSRTTVSPPRSAAWDSDGECGVKPSNETEGGELFQAVVKNTFIQMVPSHKHGRRSQSLPCRGGQ
jgi:hypothetical protein